MKLWSRLWWISPENWQGESWKKEYNRRTEALESSIQEAHIRLNYYDNRINQLRERLGISDQDGRDNPGEE